MKTVIYKSGGIYYTTSEENYNAKILNARTIHNMCEFNSPTEIMDYYYEFCGVETKDFKMSETVAKEFLMQLGWNEYGADAILKEIDITTVTVADLVKLSEDYKDR